VKVLVLGDSDSSGSFSGERTWTDGVRDGLQAERGDDVMLESIAFSALPPTAAPYAERKLRQLEPDLVILPVGSFLFTAGFVWVRVRRLFGDRAGRWYRAMEERWDRQTRDRGRIRSALNRYSRTAVRLVIGTQPLSTREAITDSYRDVFRTIARFEHVHVLVMTYPGLGDHARRGQAPAARKRFFADVRAAAESHHYTWLEGTDIFAGIDYSDLTEFHDGLHFNQKGQQLIADAVLGALARTALPA
jgi:lysophospholipase L1-like esterase